MVRSVRRSRALPGARASSSRRASATSSARGRPCHRRTRPRPDGTGRRQAQGGDEVLDRGGPCGHVGALGRGADRAAVQQRRHLEQRAVGGGVHRRRDGRRWGQGEQVVVRPDEAGGVRVVGAQRHATGQHGRPATARPRRHRPAPQPAQRQDQPERHAADPHDERPGRPVRRHGPADEGGPGHEDGGVEPARRLVGVGEQFVDQLVEVVPVTPAGASGAGRVRADQRPGRVRDDDQRDGAPGRPGLPGTLGGLGGRHGGAYSPPWQTASTLLPSGSRTKAPK